MKRSTATRYAKRLDKLVHDRAWWLAADIRRVEYTTRGMRSERDFFAELAVELRRLAAKKGKQKQSKVGAA